MPKKLGVEKLIFKPFEDESDLECLFSLLIGGRKIGGCLLRQGRDRFCLRFAFRVSSIHTFMSDEQIEATLTRLEEGLRGLLDGESLRIHFRSFANDIDRQNELEALAQASSIPELQFLLFSQQRYTRELSEQGLRQPKEILLFATYTIEPGKTTTTDTIERMIARFVESYEAIKGRRSQLEEVRYQHVLTQGFKAGYLHWEQELNIRLGLGVVPLDVEELWKVI
ncbi:MAG: hypothetical protein MUC48_06625, partial [Leptolyngbya sp. Prado105]|nr:hypothetical protein [Leptolyngbya sp. Prado105]